MIGTTVLTGPAALAFGTSAVAKYIKGDSEAALKDAILAASAASIFSNGVRHAANHALSGVMRPIRNSVFSTGVVLTAAGMIMGSSDPRGASITGRAIEFVGEKTAQAGCLLLYGALHIPAN